MKRKRGMKKQSIIDLIRKDGKWFGGIKPFDVAWVKWSAPTKTIPMGNILYHALSGKILARDFPFDWDKDSCKVKLILK